MFVLIVESDPGLTQVWTRHLERCGATVFAASDEDEAIEIIKHRPIDVIVADLSPIGGSAITIADFASYCRPRAKVVFVTKSSFFSDGSIFNVVPNAAAFVVANTPPDDLAAIVEHHAAH